MGGDADRRFGEHRVGDDRAEDAAPDLGGEVLHQVEALDVHQVRAAAAGEIASLPFPSVPGIDKPALVSWLQHALEVLQSPDFFRRATQAVVALHPNSRIRTSYWASVTCCAYHRCRRRGPATGVTPGAGIMRIGAAKRLACVVT